MMKSIISLWFVLAAIGFAYLPAAAYAQCVAFDKPEELFAHSDVVFRGTVVAKEATGAQGEHQIVDVGTFRVEQSWKGAPARQVRIGADRAFEKDKEYLVFASGKPLSTSILCRWAEPIERAKAKLDWLLKNRLANRRMEPTRPSSRAVMSAQRAAHSQR